MRRTLLDWGHHTLNIPDDVEIHIQSPSAEGIRISLVPKTQLGNEFVLTLYDYELAHFLARYFKGVERDIERIVRGRAEADK